MKCGDWFFTAKLSNGAVVRDFALGGGVSPWVEMVNKYRDKGVRIAELALRNTRGMRVTLPPSSDYFHLKKAVFELSSGKPSRHAYAVGFLSGGIIHFLWGRDDDEIVVETRVYNEKQAKFMMPGTAGDSN